MRMRLCEFCEINPRISLKKGEMAKKIAMTDLPTFAKHIKHYEIEEYKGGTKFQNGDTLMARITPCLENGKGGYVDLLENDEVAFGSTEYIVFRERPGVSNSQFLYYFTNTTEFKDIAIKSMTGTSGRQRVQTDLIVNTEFEFPELEEQRKIANILCYLDEKINVNNKLNENLANTAEIIYKSWFIDFDPFRNEEFIVTDGGLIPKSWTICDLDSCCSIIAKGITPQYTDISDQIVINQKCIRDGKINLKVARFHIPKKINEKWLQKGDILINSTGQGTLGRVGQIIETPRNLVVDSHVTIVRPKNKQLIHYLGCMLLTKQSVFAGMASGSTGQTDLPRNLVKTMNIILPSNEVLDDFSQIVIPIREKMILLQNENVKLENLRDMLLPKLMTGVIDLENFTLDI